MSSIYIHIPYCKKKCSYCNFHFRISKNDKDEMIQAMIKELDLRENYLKSKKLNSLYFGGGTPSILNQKEIELLFNKVREKYLIDENTEISFECNPDDLDKEKLLLLKKLGVNRLSIGIQSFNDEDLNFMNRSHNSTQAMDCVKFSQEIGFNNISIDLIFSLPNQTLKDWKRNLDIAFNLGIQHISSYSLTIEEKTKINHLIKTKKITELDDDISLQQYNLLIKESEKNDFTHYEISNFGKENYFSKHNSSYWLGNEYLGIGPSAHSYNRKSRSWNVRSNKKYISEIKNNRLPSETEILTNSEKFNDYIMTHLRTIWGVDTNYILKYFGEKILSDFIIDLKKWENSKDLTHQDENVKLTKKGKYISDAICSDLFTDS